MELGADVRIVVGRARVGVSECGGRRVRVIALVVRCAGWTRGRRSKGANGPEQGEGDEAESDTRGQGTPRWPVWWTTVEDSDAFGVPAQNRWKCSVFRSLETI